MSAERFQVDTDLLRKSSSDLQKSLQNMQSARQKLETQLKSLSAVWKGPAQEAFHKQFTNDLNEFEQLCAHLDELVQSMGKAAKAYDYYDGKVKSIVDAVRI